MKWLKAALLLIMFSTPALAQVTYPIPFNTCPNLSTDAFGQGQCPGYIDPDNSWVFPSESDPKLIPFMKPPLNFQRLKIEDGFNKPALESWWTTTTYGTGSLSISPATQSHACIHTGTGASSGVEMRLTTAFATLNTDAWSYFFIEVQTEGQFDLQFGYENPATSERVMLRRYDLGTANPWEAYTQNAAGAATGVYSTHGGDNQRRIGIIQLKPAEADFYVSGAGNRFDPSGLPIAITTNLPASASPLNLFVKFLSVGANAADQVACISKATFSEAE